LRAVKAAKLGDEWVALDCLDLLQHTATKRNNLAYVFIETDGTTHPFEVYTVWLITHGQSLAIRTEGARILLTEWNCYALLLMTILTSKSFIPLYSAI
jgi:hypothetical protein